MTKSFCWLLSGVLFTSFVGTAFAADPAELARMRVTFVQAEDDFKANRFKEARDAFLKVLEVVQVPAVAYKAAQADERLGELLAAAAMYQRATELRKNDLWADPATQQKAQRDANTALTALKGRIPTLQLEIQGDASTISSVTVDGQAREAITAPLQVDPGQHEVVVSTATRSTITKVVTVGERQHEIITINLAEMTTAAPVVAPANLPPAAATTSKPVATEPATPREPNAPPKPNHKTSNTIGWIGVGVGAAGIALGATAGIVSLVKHSDMTNAGCDDKGCPQGVYDAKNSAYDTWRTISTAGFVVGGIAAAAGVTWMLVEGRRDSSARVGVTLSPNAVELRGGF